MEWDDFEFWDTGEGQVVVEKFDDLDEAKRKDGSVAYHPPREDTYAAMDIVPFDEVKVAVFGQDPYPEPKYATGVAFSIRDGYRTYPPTLKNIFKEYSDDLHLTEPTTGNLEAWCKQGVFLWNVNPVYLKTKGGSQVNWVEWEELNKEIIQHLANKGCVFVFLGAHARQYEKYVQPKVDDKGFAESIPQQDTKKNIIISTSHPSPLGVLKGTNPFFGSRIFSRINAALNTLGHKPIEWKLKGSRTSENKKV